MTDCMTLDDALLGGPGLDGYTFEAEVYCVDCGQEYIHDCFRRRGGEPLPLLEACDSEILPQPIFFGEHERPQHCGACLVYLYGDKGDVS